MKPTRLVLICCATFACAVMAQNLPKQKAGMWETVTTLLNPDGTAYRIGGKAVPPSTSVACRDEAMAKQIDKLGSELAGGFSGRSCRQAPAVTKGNQITMVVECDIGGNMQRITSVMTINNENSYRTEGKITYDRPPPGLTDMVSVADTRYVGACKPGMQPGDVTMNGVTTNTRDMIPSSAQDIAKTMDDSAEAQAKMFEQIQQSELAKLAVEAKQPGGALGIAGILVTVAGAAAGARGKGGSASRNAQVAAAAANTLAALSVDEEQVKKMASYFVRLLDRENVPLPDDSIYNKRLHKLSKDFTNYDGLRLNFKVYKSDTLNAFALSDGSIRFYSGLMDLMDDDELRFVIGHEIGHVKRGHTMAQTKAAFLTAAVANGAAAAAMKSGKGEAVVNLAGESLKDLFKKVLGSSYSRESEYESDQYAFEFMKKHRIPVRAAIGALTKLSKASGNRTADLYATHPSGPDRVAAIKRAAGEP